MEKPSAPVYQIKITLKDITPSIWRRVIVSSETKLSQFHDIIQAVMGWENSHLYMFKIGVVQFSYPYEAGDLEEMTAIDSQCAKLIHIVPHHRPFTGKFHFIFDYEYDFGDGWDHEVLFEDVLPPNPKQKPPLCLDGERACPPEDVGGVGGYEAFLDAIQNPQHPEHDTNRAWIGKSFKPERFDIKAVNTALRKLKVLA